MRKRARLLVGAISVCLATLVGGPALAVEADRKSVHCDPVGTVSPAHVSCTVVGPEGSEATLVLASTDAAGSQEVTSFSKPMAGDSATFTKPVPEGAAQLTVVGLVDGAEVDSAVVSIPYSPGDPDVLGVPDITIAASAFAALAMGALILFAGARKRGVERRSTGSYQGVAT